MMFGYMIQFLKDGLKLNQIKKFKDRYQVKK